MRKRSVIFGLVAILGVAALAFYVTQALAPSSTTSPYLVALIAASAVLGAAAFFSGLFDASQFFDNLFSPSRAKKRDAIKREMAEDRAREEQEANLNAQRQNSLETYIGHVSKLLLEKSSLQPPELNERERNIIRNQTIFFLEGLDEKRKAQVIRFLYEQGLITKNHDPINLGQADLSNIDLESANLPGICLTGANLKGAKLSGTNLSGAELIRSNLTEARMDRVRLLNADLREANLKKAYLYLADLSRANVRGAHLEEAYLCEAGLTQCILDYARLDNANFEEARMENASLIGTWLESAYMRGAILHNANLRGTHMSFACLRGASLADANITGVFLFEANLEEATVDLTKLKKSNYLTKTIMPNGQKYEEWIENIQDQVGEEALENVDRVVNSEDDLQEE